MHRIDNLTGVRAVAALWVVLFHLNLLDTPARGRLGTVVAHGMFGVDVFFVLSGFVLSLVYTGRMPERFRWVSYRAFLLRRLAKIYPMHLLTLIGMVALVRMAAVSHYLFTSGAQNTTWTALCSLLLVHSLGTTAELSWNGPSWSVSAEWFAYAVLFVPMIFVLRRVRTWWIACGVVLLLMLLAAATPLLGEPWTQLDTRGALRIVPEFLCGYLLYRLVRRRTLPNGDLLAAVGAATLLLTCYVPGGSLYGLLPGTMLLLAGLHSGGPLSDRLFGNRVLVQLGEASYSIYLLQTFVLVAIKQMVLRAHLPRTTGVAILLAVLVPTVAGAAGVLCFRMVEEPLRQLVLRRFGVKRNPEQAASSVVRHTAQDTQVAATIG